MGLDKLPTEILGLVAQFLDVRDNGNLRLTSQLTASKLSCGHFRTYFRTKVIPLRVESLISLNKILQPNSLVCLLENATITKNVSGGASDNGKVEELLTKTFITLKNNNGGLQSLNLNIIRSEKRYPTEFRSLTELAESAARHATFRITMLALQKSGLSVHDLNLFGNLVGQSLPISCIREMPDLNQLSNSLQKVKSFSMSLTSDEPASPDIDPQEFDFEDTDFQDTSSHDSSSQATSQADATDGSDDSDTPSKLDSAAVSRFLRLMPSLEALDLHWYKTQLLAWAPETFFFETCFTSISPTLKTCTLRGIYIAEQPLLSFLQQTSARRITLRELHLTAGTFVPIFEALTRQTDPFEHLHLDDLFENETSYMLVRFKLPGELRLPPPGVIKVPEPGEVKFRVLYDNVGPSEIVREGEEVMQKLVYGFARGRPVGGPVAQNWFRKRKEAYGPDERHASRD